MIFSVIWDLIGNGKLVISWGQSALQWDYVYHCSFCAGYTKIKSNSRIYDPPPSVACMYI